MVSVVSRSRRAHRSERGIGQFIVYALLVVFVVGAGLQWRSRQLLHSVRITGLHTLAEAEIRQVLDSTLLPAKVADIDLQAVRRAVLAIPFVRSVVVQRTSEYDVEIAVTEREPLALVVTMSGDPVYVDKDAVLLPYRPLGQSKDIPLIRGLHASGSGFDSTGVHEVVSLLREMLATDGSTLYNDISEIVFEPGNRSFSFETSADGSKVVFGTFENHSEKILNLYSLRRATSSASQYGAASVIDVRWKDKVFVTKRVS